MQIESIEAVTHARYLAKPGVDCLSFGPADLTFSIESHPNHALQTVDACVEYVARALEGTTTAVCFRMVAPAHVKSMRTWALPSFWNSHQRSVRFFLRKLFSDQFSVFS